MWKVPGGAGRFHATPENTVEHSPIPLHTGTIKYLLEKGLEVPERLRAGGPVPEKTP